MTYINVKFDIDIAMGAAAEIEIEKIRQLLLNRRVSFTSDDYHTQTTREGIVKHVTIKWRTHECRIGFEDQVMHEVVGNIEIL